VGQPAESVHQRPAEDEITSSHRDDRHILLLREQTLPVLRTTGGHVRKRSGIELRRRVGRRCGQRRNEAKQKQFRFVEPIQADVRSPERAKYDSPG